MQFTNKYGTKFIVNLAYVLYIGKVCETSFDIHIDGGRCVGAVFKTKHDRDAALVGIQEFWSK